MLSIDDHLMGACRIRFWENVGNFVFSIFQNLISLGTIHKCGETHTAWSKILHLPTKTAPYIDIFVGRRLTGRCGVPSKYCRRNKP